MKEKNDNPATEISKTKKFIFSLFALLLPFLLLVFVELGLRLFKYGGDTSLFISAPDEISEYYMINHNVGKRYFFMQNTVPDPSKDLFLKRKPENGIRIFVLGGSTAAGFPYGNNVMFSRILHKRLADTFPYKHIEVVNIAMAAVNSYTLLDLLDEVLEKEPDAILIYAGHNEFYGALGVASNEYMGKIRWFVKTYLELKDLKLFILIRDFIAKSSKGLKKAVGKDSEMDPTATLMARIVGDPAIPYGSKTFQLGKMQFERNLIEIVKKVQKHKVPLILSELVSNVKNKPFKSVYSDTLPPADKIFYRAQETESQGKYSEANRLYRWAKDLDVLRFRAPEQFNRIIHQVADTYHVPVVGMQDYFAEHSKNGIIGYDLILEHLHPNVQGYFIMAEAFYDILRAKRLFSDYWDEKNIKSTSTYLKNWGITNLDSTYEYISLLYLMGGWPFVEMMGPNNTLNNYHPKNKIEKLAIKILTNNAFGLEMGHLELAKSYESEGLYRKAFNEYKALIYMIPYEELFVKGAIEAIIKLKDYNTGLDILFTSNEFRDTGFVNKWIGQLYLANNRSYEAAFYLERAFSVIPGDIQLVESLYRAYLLNFQFDKIDEILRKFPKNKISDAKIIEMKKREKIVKSTCSDLIRYMNDARGYIQNNEWEKAKKILKKILQFKEIPDAYCWLGKLYLQEHNVDQGLNYLHKGLILSPYDYDLLYTILYVYIKTNKEHDAEEIYEELNYIYPDFKDPLNIRDHFLMSKVR